MADHIDLSDILADFKGDVQQAVEDAEEQAAKQAVAQLKASSPKHKGAYAKGWSKKKVGKGITVYNRTEPQLTHLLENGHLNRDGSRTPGHAHIAPANEQAIATFIKLVEQGVAK